MMKNSHEMLSTPDVLDQDLRDERREILLETTREALHHDELEMLCLVLIYQHPADLAELIRVLDSEYHPLTMELLDSRPGTSG